VSTLPAGNERFRQLILRFINRLHAQLAKMDAAERSGDLKALANLAHWLKGAGGTVGFDVFTEPAARLEAAARNGEAQPAKSILRHLHRLAGRLAVAGSATPSEPAARRGISDDTAQTVEAAQRRSLASRLAGNPKFHPSICKFIDKLRDQVEKMEAAHRTGDMEQLAQLAHWLKGAGGTVGFDDFTEPTAQLEAFALAGAADQSGRMLDRVKQLERAIVRPGLETGGRPSRAPDDGGLPKEAKSAGGVS
jgi:HPt (histidine-containing phosphotransfer) domain-containing protein